MADPVYRETPNHGGNIGVLLGTVSEGICAVELDADAYRACHGSVAGAFNVNRTAEPNGETEGGAPE